MTGVGYLDAAQELRRNPQQWAAYRSKGNCVVLAGPGSGKTKTLTLKVARLLSEEIHEKRGVACITYNNECVRELENRFEVLGIESGRRVFIGTLHSFSLTPDRCAICRDGRSGSTGGVWCGCIRRARRSLEPRIR